MATARKADKTFATATGRAGAEVSFVKVKPKLMPDSDERRQAVLRTEGRLFAKETGISAGELREELLEGNRRFAEKISPEKLRELAEGKEQAVVIQCSDARLNLAKAVDQLEPERIRDNIEVVQIAGNVVTPETKKPIIELASANPDAEIIIMAHPNCGAINASLAGKAESENIGGIFSAFETKSKELRLSSADSQWKLAVKNTKIQRDALMADPDVRAALGGREIVLMIFDQGTYELEVINSESLRQGSIVRGWLAANEEARVKMAPSLSSLEEQYAGSVIILGDTPLSAEQMFQQEPNRIFVVDIRESDSIGKAAAGSVEYAVGHVKGVNHIGIVVKDPEVAERWARELLGQSRIVAEKVAAGLEITFFIYDEATGRTSAINAVRPAA